MAIIPIKLGGRELGPHKAVVDPLLNSRSVLTNSPWTFVSLWLKRNGRTRALFYWEQAEEFHRASIGLPIRSAPLLLYYCFMNVAKALLVAKGMAFDEGHGVRARATPPGQRRTFPNEAILIRPRGILPSLAAYYGETETSRTHTLQHLFFNMVFIHRTYCLTYSSQKEIYLPLANCRYVYDSKTKHVYFKANIEKDFPYKTGIRMLPPSFVAAPEIDERAIRSVAFLAWRRPGRPSEANIHELSVFNRALRKELQYINGTQALWYLRSPVAGPGQLNRQLPTLILGSMHRLSEICRYHPLQLDAFLAGQKNWLLSEFIEMSAVQFIDEMASELTGHQFLVPNVRAAS